MLFRYDQSPIGEQKAGSENHQTTACVQSAWLGPAPHSL